MASAVALASPPAPPLPSRVVGTLPPNSPLAVAFADTKPKTVLVLAAVALAVELPPAPPEKPFTPERMLPP